MTTTFIILFFSSLTTITISPISFETVKNVSVFSAPNRNSKIIGRVYKGSLFPLLKKHKNKPCKSGYFVKIAENKYICSTYIRGSFSFPVNKNIPYLPKGRLLPFQYKMIRKRTPVFTNKNEVLHSKPVGFLPFNSHIVFKHRFRKINGILFTLNEDDLLIPHSNTDNPEIPDFKGLHIKNGTANFNAAVINLKGAAVYISPGRRSSEKKIKYHTWLKIKDFKHRIKRKNKVYFKLKTGKWIREEDIKRFYFTKPPSYLQKNNNLWIEIILSQQTLVLYRGKTPIFMTLVSTARKPYSTPVGVFRIFYKKGFQKLSSKKKGKWTFYFEHVPWIQFFSGNIAIHTAYWHNMFGSVSSMGCIEISPSDAYYLYNMTSPEVPAGFISYTAYPKYTGTIVRIKEYPNQPVNYRAGNLKTELNQITTK